MLKVRGQSQVFIEPNLEKGYGKIGQCPWNLSKTATKEGTQRQSDQRQSGSKGGEQINGACAEHGSQSCKTDVCIPENSKKLRQWQSWGEGEQNPLCFSVGRRLKWVIINRESRRKGQRGKSQFLKQGGGGVQKCESNRKQSKTVQQEVRILTDQTVVQHRS